MEERFGLSESSNGIKNKYDQQELKSVEMELIENYLEETLINDSIFETVVDEQALIFTLDGKCVYKGNKKDAEDLIRRSDELFTMGNDTYYLAIK